MVVEVSMRVYKSPGAPGSPAPDLETWKGQLLMQYFCLAIQNGTTSWLYCIFPKEWTIGMQIS